MNKYDISVYYFPNFHEGDPRNDKWHGKGWTEWEVLKHATPRFDGHYIPTPLWGYEDEKDPEVMEKKIKYASENGINNFIFDWYYYDDGPFLNRCLEEGFLKAKNTNDIKFSIMWANHDWKHIHPISLDGLDHPLIQAYGKVKPTTFDEIMDYVIDHYFVKENYYRLDGGLYFSIYELYRFIDSLGGINNAKEAIIRFRKKVKDRGLGKLHMNAVTWGCKILDGESTKPVTAELLKEIGFDSTGSYVWIHEHPTKKFPTNEYEDYINECSGDFEKLSKKYQGLPYYPNVTVGWDSSPRTVQSDKFTEKWYPFMGILVNNTPELFEKALREIKKQLDNSDLKTKMFTINAWNEWTEGSYLEPDDRYGDSKLKAIKKVFIDENL